MAAKKKKAVNKLDLKTLTEHVKSYFESILSGGHQVHSIDAEFDIHVIIGEKTGWEAWEYDGFVADESTDNYLKFVISGVFFENMHPSSFEITSSGWDPEYWAFSVTAKE